MNVMDSSSIDWNLGIDTLSICGAILASAILLAYRYGRLERSIGSLELSIAAAAEQIARQRDELTSQGQRLATIEGVISRRGCSDAHGG